MNLYVHGSVGKQFKISRREEGKAVGYGYIYWIVTQYNNSKEEGREELK